MAAPPNLIANPDVSTRELAAIEAEDAVPGLEAIARHSEEATAALRDLRVRQTHASVLVVTRHVPCPA